MGETGLRRALEWDGDDGRFRFSCSEQVWSLQTPDGELLELPPRVWKLIAAAVSEVESWKHDDRKRRALPVNAGKPWTEALDRKLVSEWTGGASITELAHSFARTRGSIESRLFRLGLLPERMITVTQHP